MDACVKSATLSGVDGRLLEVTAVAEPGPPGFEQRGMRRQRLGQRAARERAALRLAGTPWRVNAEVPRDELLRRFMPGGGGREPVERAASLGTPAGPS